MLNIKFNGSLLILNVIALSTQRLNIWEKSLFCEDFQGYGSGDDTVPAILVTAGTLEPTTDLSQSPLNAV